jgi:hypothetical protein
MIAVKYDDLMLAFDFVGSAPPMEHGAYISLDTGEIYWTSELNPNEEDLPEDFETSDRYIAIPHKNDLDLGMNLALSFVRQELPELYEQARSIFRSKGAYRRFKQFLESERLLEMWYKFEAQSVEKALGDWCADNGIETIDKDNESSV